MLLFCSRASRARRGPCYISVAYDICPRLVCAIIWNVRVFSVDAVEQCLVNRGLQVRIVYRCSPRGNNYFVVD